jgi:cell division protein FtsL
MAQKKKSKKQPVKKTQKKISRNQRVMVIIGVFIIIAMLLPSLLYFFK